MKKIRIYLLSILFFAGVTGCTEWLDVNQNPNSLTNSDIDHVLIGAEKQFSERQQLGTGFALLGAWVGYYGHSGGWSGWNNVKSYNMTSSDYNGFFTGPYLNELKSLNYIEEQGYEEGNYAYVAIAKIMKSALFQRLVDTYGDVPYSEFGNGLDNTQPIYDDAKDIYEDIIVQLDSAIFFLNEKSPDGLPFVLNSTYDIIGRGDLTIWKQYANTIKLRVLLRQAEMSDRQSYVTSKMKFDDVGFLTTSLTANPGYIENNNKGKMCPIYGYGKNYKGNLTSANQQYGLNIFLLTLYNDNSDPRLALCWEPGVESGDYSHGLQLGINGAEEDHWKEAAIRMGPGIYGVSDDDVTVMSVVEADFLQAEALARGYDLSSAGVSGTGEDQFNKGIEHSFNYYGERAGVDQVDVDTLLQEYNFSLTGDVAWDAANPVKSIMYQKYIAGVGLYHYETWADYRRTGYPNALDPTVVDNSLISYYFNIVRAQVPVRMLYTQKELDINSENVKAAIDKTGVPYNSEFIMDANIFWDVK